MSNKNLKLNVSERLRNSLTALGEYQEASRTGWLKGLPTIKQHLYYNPVLVVTVSLLVHSGRHLRVAGPGQSPTEGQHTSLFTTTESGAGPISYVVDFVPFSQLASALPVIDSSFKSLVAHLSPYLKKSPRPLK